VAIVAAAAREGGHTGLYRHPGSRRTFVAGLVFPGEVQSDHHSQMPLHDEPVAEVLPENNAQAAERLHLKIEIDDDDDAAPMALGEDDQC
jgi:hypothetical protein